MKPIKSKIDKYNVCITCKAFGIQAPIMEYKPFGKDNDCTKEYRKKNNLKDWRLDYVWIDGGMKFAIEIDGGAWINGRHNRGQGYIDGMIRRNALLEYGWYVLYYPPNKIDYAQIQRIYNELKIKSMANI